MRPEVGNRKDGGVSENGDTLELPVEEVHLQSRFCSLQRAKRCLANAGLPRSMWCM
jgi:hypothetical protein